MTPKGLAFAIVTDRGFAIGLRTHKVESFGELAWLAEPFFDEAPSVADLRAIQSWRWCVFFPVTTGLRRHVLIRIGLLEVPEPLVDLPTFRGQALSGEWVCYERGDLKRHVGACDDPSVQVRQLVNLERIKEMLTTGWRPQDRWDSNF